MRKVNIVCIGKLKEKFFAEAVAEYCKRLTRFASVQIVELPERRTLAEEAAAVLREMRGACFVLAVEGKRCPANSWRRPSAHSATRAGR